MTNQNNEIKYETLTKTEQVVTDLLRSIVSLNFHSLNQQIENQRLRKQLDPDNDYKRRSKLSKEDQQTPEKLIELLCKQYTEIKVTDLFLDVCCGRGSMLFYLHNTYGIPKENLYGIDIDRRNVEFLKSRGFNNIVLGDALDEDTWAELNAKLKSNTLYIIKDTNKEGETESMPKFDKVIMNPPYAKTLHLDILKQVNKECPESVIVNISPAAWLTDIEPKARNTYKTVADKITDIKLIDGLTAGKQFAISLPDGLAITKYNEGSIIDVNLVIPQMIKDIVVKVKSKTSSVLNDYIEKDMIDGWRVEVKPQLPTGIDLSHLYTDSEFHKQRGGKICPDSSVFFNGKDSIGRMWFDTRAKGKTYNGDEKLPASIKFKTEEEAMNFKESCHANFFKNLVFIVRSSVSPRMNILPYMEDYSHAWTDEDYCKFFELTPEESEFMCRTVDDYRVKDFINYEEI